MVKTEKRRRLRRILLFALAVLLVILLLYMVFLMFRVFLRLDAEDPEVPCIEPSYAAGQGILFPDREPIHDPAILNILFLGTDFQLPNEERGRADSNMLCSLNTRTGAIRLVSFERGIGVPVPGRGSDLLTHAWHWGGSGVSQAIISQMFCVEIAGYVQVDFNSFAEIITAIGGVDVELTELEAKALNGEITTNTWAQYEVHEGLNHLWGHDALEYSRLRSIDSDWNRQMRQRNVISAIKKQCLKVRPDLLIDIVLPRIHTNLSRGDLMRLITAAPVLLSGKVTQLQVPDHNGRETYIRCNTDYESKKISNFLYHTDYELSSPY